MKQEVDWLRVYRYFMREEGEEDASQGNGNDFPECGSF